MPGKQTLQTKGWLLFVKNIVPINLSRPVLYRTGFLFLYRQECPIFRPQKIRQMKFLLLLLLVLTSKLVISQEITFPQSWVGNWKGELEWFRTGKKESQKVNMELRIQRGDSTGNYTWQIIYGSAAEDNRPYLLKAKDITNGHWVIDELNGIILDQFWVGKKFCGAFTVMNNTIVNNYWIEDEKLMVEFYSISAKPIATTGSGTEESPSVDSYKIGSYQKAVLQRVK